MNSDPHPTHGDCPAIDDVGFIREVIARVERQAKIDRRRIFATGMSNGAMMSWRLACEAPEVRAIAPVEGTDNTASCNPARPVPVIEFHAVNDEMVNFNGGPGPNLTRIADRLPAQGIARTLVNPTAPMPSFSSLQQNEPEKFDAMVAFLGQLK